MCLGCGKFEPGGLCHVCRATLRPAPERVLPGVGWVRSAFVHEGPARQLVHHLKYRGVVSAGRVLAEAMAEAIEGAVVLVPVPRLRWRELRYGVDPALELASALAHVTGRRLVRALRAPWFGPSRAGSAHGWAPDFRRSLDLGDAPALLVDDVVTSGSTLIAAASRFPQVAGAVTATSASAGVLGSACPLGSIGDGRLQLPSVSADSFRGAGC